MRQQISRLGEVISAGIEHVSRRTRNPKKRSKAQGVATL
jgi:hypothetical protein